jgi:hypothetical protein
LITGNRVIVKASYSDYFDLVGVVVGNPSKDRYHVSFDQTELRKARRPEIVLKSKSNVVYFTINELESVNVTA